MMSDRERDARLGPLQREPGNVVLYGNLVVSAEEKNTAISCNIEIII
jgi:hypothetical protein